MLEDITEESDIIHKKKNYYYNSLPKKLSDITTNTKTYWSISKTFHNTRKVSFISPILIENNLEAGFNKKAYSKKFSLLNLLR